MGVLKPELIFKSIVPIIMAGILGIYGLIVSVILKGKSKPPLVRPACSLRHLVLLPAGLQALRVRPLLRPLLAGKRASL